MKLHRCNGRPDKVLNGACAAVSCFKERNLKTCRCTLEIVRAMHWYSVENNWNGPPMNLAERGPSLLCRKCLDLGRVVVPAWPGQGSTSQARNYLSYFAAYCSWHNTLRRSTCSLLHAKAAKSHHAHPGCNQSASRGMSIFASNHKAS